jgi:hypothetical protein
MIRITDSIALDERDQARKPQAGLHIVADLHGAVAEGTLDGRTDHGEGEVALRLLERGLELGEHVPCLPLLRP